MCLSIQLKVTMAISMKTRQRKLIGKKKREVIKIAFFKL